MLAKLIVCYRDMYVLFDVGHLGDGQYIRSFLLSTFISTALLCETNSTPSIPFSVFLFNVTVHRIAKTISRHATNHLS